MPLKEDTSFRGIIVGTSRLKTLICTPPFLLGWSNIKSEGDDEMMERQEKQVRIAIQAEITFSARKKFKGDYN
jgi:hypothetical protein